MSEPVIHVIDDDAAVRGSLSLLLRSASMAVQTYASATEFLAQAAYAAPGCIVTDIHMPDMSGLELAHQLKARGVSHPIIAISGAGGVPVAVEAMRMGAVNFLQKPFREGALLEAINSALAGEVTPQADQLAKASAAALAAERQRVHAIHKAFSRYLAPAVVDRLVADPTLLHLGGETRDMTILFADIRGFTSISETMKEDPQGLTGMINSVLGTLSEIVIAHGGTIDKYIGDCIMAFWGAPCDDPDHAERAVAAAKEMLAAMNSINADLRAAGSNRFALPRVSIGVGVNSGECVVGNIGCARRFDYSVLGDPVNIASRLVGLSKSYDVDLLLGQATANRLRRPDGLKEVDRIAVRGRSETQAIYAVA